MIQLSDLSAGSFPVLYVDPPTRFVTRSAKGKKRSADRHYPTMTWPQIMAMAEDIDRVAHKHAVLLCWTTWPQLLKTLAFGEACGFTYKTAGFDWLKADGRSLDLFDDTIKADMKMGYWTRQNGEPCLLFTRGTPKRLKADVRMGIIEPARQHSRKPDIVYSRIERLLAGPYLELFGRTTRPGWTTFGNQTGRFAPVTA
jgi:N6-adenosine-specific RNA methylase IME4